MKNISVSDVRIFQIESNQDGSLCYGQFAGSLSCKIPALPSGQTSQVHVLDGEWRDEASCGARQGVCPDQSGTRAAPGVI